MNTMMTPSWVFVLLAEGRITRTYYSDSEETLFVLTSWCSVHNTETTNANVIVFVLTRLELEPTVNRTRCEYANHYITDMGQITDRRQTYKQSPLN